MKKLLIFIVLIICLMLSVILFWIKTGSKEVVNSGERVELNSTLEEQEAILDKVVMIKDGKIFNEDIIDNFIEAKKTDGMELNIIDEDKNICIRYVAPTEPQSGENGYDIGDGSFATRKKIFGYYILYKDGEEYEFTDIEHSVARYISDDKVVLYFDAPLIEYIEIWRI